MTAENRTEPRRVLVAEDEGLIRLDIVETLTSAGFTVVGEAADGEGAVEGACSRDVDVVLLDLRMPGIGGVEACRRIKECNPDVNVLGSRASLTMTRCSVCSQPVPAATSSRTRVRSRSCRP